MSDQPEVTEYKLSKKLASRRFILSCTALLISSLLMATERMEASSFENIVIWITGIYVIGKPFGDQVSKFLTQINK